MTPLLFAITVGNSLPLGFIHLTQSQMKKIILMLMLMFSLSISAQHWQGNRYIDAPKKSTKYIETPYTYTNKKGEDCGVVFINKENGHCKVNVVNKDGKTVSRYLSEKVSKEYARKMNIPYIPSKPKR